MALEIVWSPRALDNFHGVVSHLEENWFESVIKDFVKRTEHVLHMIADHPNMFRQISEDSLIREAVITKHNLLIYKVTESKVIVLAVYDTRQHPKKKQIF
ncbi:type II toxin-antitoxin system RelE/ParE family toxin [Dyadobacter chenwenxiniae]|uniref:Type II toxin-antitoxin system RelE/ParE family toxin n=1 Tax=Dyadobacter chenwenxiniae TaxID=2906456 RepID=A0A9X1THC2_9BACT|nr:type II toxin-antitoxin system RelE/ParE family toxin [Dyadobacter chenwenxiniae]MCF0064329.1 type II toxin-antitoxin system RelE/ParE family toxin [Dyadobacter chenwenxiniae]UON82460.1 type II toxin-antitoxin system RelE/ParE family toxin [Dyadobacter chenwenxiniae]